MKVSEHIADYLATVNPRVYAVCGAGAMHLNDAICHHEGLSVVAMHHEQAATFAAEADARVSGRPGIVSVTAGPGGTNTMTGVACAYVDSIPLIMIAGQVTAKTMRRNGMRQLGMNELPMVDLMRPITKYATTLYDPAETQATLDRAHHIAISGRPGPVFIEVPLDVQAAESPKQWAWAPAPVLPDDLTGDIAQFLRLVRSAHRPLFIIGNGVRSAGDLFIRLLSQMEIPFTTSWAATDLVPNDHPCFMGHIGIFGDRAANFAVQNADLVISLGTRLSVPQVGHAPELFGRNAQHVVVDIDPSELVKPGLEPDLAICANVRDFLEHVLSVHQHHGSRWHDWRSRCLQWKFRYPVGQDAKPSGESAVNAYHLARQIARHAPDNAIIVTDVGFSYLPLMQTLRVKKGQRLMHSGGVSPMGWAIPAAIGAARAGEGRPVICVTGDGGAMLNLQELATIAHHGWPITILVLENGGYATMRIAQRQHFGRDSIAGFETGLACPDFTRVADAFGLPTFSVHDDKGVSDWMHFIASRKHPMVCEVHMARDQVIAPRVLAKTDNGKFLPAALEDMWPYLDRDELAENMGERAEESAA